MRERRLGEEVVGEPVRELRERVRRARRDEQQVGARQMKVDVVAGRPARKRAKGLSADEALGPGRNERHDLMPAPDEEPANLARLVSGNPPRDAQKNPSHQEMMPGKRQQGPRPEDGANAKR